MKKVLSLLFTVMLSALMLSGVALTPRTVEGQDVKNRMDEKPKGRAVRSYRGEQGGPRPDWVESARARSLEFLKQHGNVVGLRQPTTELGFVSALEDDLGLTHVRLEQVHKGVPVFANQIITHMDAKGFGETTGRANEAARQVGTTPRLNAAAAIKEVGS